MTQLSTAPDPIDLKEALEIVDDDEELLQECFEDFIENAPGMINAINKAIDAGIAVDLVEAAHKFKGTLKYLAALPAADIAYELEAMGKQGDISKASDCLQTLIEECERIKEFMSNFDGG